MRLLVLVLLAVTHGMTAQRAELLGRGKWIEVLGGCPGTTIIPKSIDTKSFGSTTMAACAELVEVHRRAGDCGSVFSVREKFEFGQGALDGTVCACCPEEGMLGDMIHGDLTLEDRDGWSVYRLGGGGGGGGGGGDSGGGAGPSVRSHTPPPEEGQSAGGAEAAALEEEVELPLPPGWRKAMSRTHGREYLYNESTGRRVWRVQSIDAADFRPQD